MINSDGWYATVEHYRTWLFIDGGFYREYEQAKVFTSDLVRRMASHYSVARTIPLPKPDAEETGNPDRNREILCEKLNTLASNWPENLTERADRIIETAKEACKDFGSGNPPYSAVSKFIWFAKPKHWTLFDSLASAGMLPNGGTSEERIREFYSALAPVLPELCDQVQTVCDKSGLTMHAEKIVDIFLMLRGAGSTRSDFGKGIAAACDHFVALLPADQSEALEQCAEKVGKILTREALPRPTKVTWRTRVAKYS